MSIYFLQLNLCHTLDIDNKSLQQEYFFRTDERILKLYNATKKSAQIFLFRLRKCISKVTGWYLSQFTFADFPYPAKPVGVTYYLNLFVGFYTTQQTKINEQKKVFYLPSKLIFFWFLFLSKVENCVSLSI